MSDTKPKTTRESKQSISQVERFREAAREVETDDHEEAFDAIVRKIAKTPPKKENKEKVGGRK